MQRLFLRRTPLLSLLLLTSTLGWSQYSYTTLASPYTQDFNGLGTVNATPAGGDLNLVSASLNGWFFSESGTNANTTITAGTGTSTTGDTYNFGAAANSDRTLGGLLSGSLTPTFGFYFTNNTGSTITSIQIAYTGETWRVGGVSRSDRLDFQYSTDATSLTTGTWTDVDALDYANPGQATVIGGSVQHSAAISATISSLSIANGSIAFIRWNDFNVTSSDDGMGVEDLTLTAFGGPTNTSVQFTTASASVAENVGTTDLTLSITNPSGSQATTANVVLISGNAARINGFSSQAVNFPAGSSANQLVTITVTDNGVNDGNAVLVFDIQNVTGGQGTPAPGSPGSFTLTVVDNDQPVVGFTLTTSGIGEGSNTTIGVTMDAQPLADVTVEVALTGGTANNGTDVNNYSTTPLTFTTLVSYPITLTVPVGTLQDFTFEGPETAIFGLSLTAGSASMGTTVHTLTITDDEVATLVINEVDYDNIGTDNAEWFEIKNTGASTLDLSGFAVQLVNGSGGGAAVYQTINLPTHNLAAGGYYVVGNNAVTPNINLVVTPATDMIQNGAPDAIGLRDPLGALVDAISYEGSSGAPYTEGTGLSSGDDNVNGSKVIARVPDGSDSNSNSTDWMVWCATPGAANGTVDNDADGTADCIDIDDDNDTVLDADEITCGSDPFNAASTCEICDGLDNDLDGFTDEGFDTDGDLTADCFDDCPLDPLKIEPGNCGCGVEDLDSDNDLTYDCNDGCPLDSLKTDPGVCGCGVADADDDGDGAMNCNDLCPNDPNKTAPGNCGCGSPDPGAACNDGNALTGDDVVQSNCTCQGELIDCLGVAGGGDLPGTACDDGIAITGNDTWDVNCVCEGDTITCQNELVLELNTDLNGAQTSWEISTAVGGVIMWLGPEGPLYGNNSTVLEPICLVNGCYKLKVYDSFGDGMTTGGYVLRYESGERLIDNTANGSFSFLSQAPLFFCLPISDDQLTPSTSDQTNLQPGDWVQANVDAAVSAQYGVTNSTSGYQFWFFNPNGGYSRRIFISHAFNNYWFAPGPTRASYLKISSVTVNPVPVSTLLNVRVRTMVAGVYGEFGPACRLTLVAPSTQLVANISSPFYSCGLTDIVLNNGQYIHANMVSGASKYQWEFTRPGYIRKIASNGSALIMNTWAFNPLQPGLTYNVRVRVSFDGGTIWGPYGESCTISIASPGALTGGGLQVILQQDDDFRLWPNPNRDGLLHLELSELPADVEEVTITLFDPQGREAMRRSYAAEGNLNLVMQLDAQLAEGVYIVRMEAGSTVFTRRLVVE